MDDPNITMVEYIQLMADKARGRHQTFNWETVTYGKVYCDDLDSFTDFETDFPAIVYNDASTSNQNVSSEPTRDRICICASHTLSLLKELILEKDQEQNIRKSLFRSIFYLFL
ncbi:hypothetical protein Tco_1034561 [Tanacetum coccineum]